MSAVEETQATVYVVTHARRRKRFLTRRAAYAAAARWRIATSGRCTCDEYESLEECPYCDPAASTQLPRRLERWLMWADASHSRGAIAHAPQDVAALIAEVERLRCRDREWASLADRMGDLIGAACPDASAWDEEGGIADTLDRLEHGYDWREEEKT